MIQAPAPAPVIAELSRVGALFQGRLVLGSLKEEKMRLPSVTSWSLSAAAVGAVLGGLAGYLFFTPRGRALRSQLEPALDDMMVELKQMPHGRPA